MLTHFVYTTTLLDVDHLFGASASGRSSLLAFRCLCAFVVGGCWCVRCLVGQLCKDFSSAVCMHLEMRKIHTAKRKTHHPSLSVSISLRKLHIHGRQHHTEILHSSDEPCKQSYNQSLGGAFVSNQLPICHRPSI